MVWLLKALIKGRKRETSYCWYNLILLVNNLVQPFLCILLQVSSNWIRGVVSIECILLTELFHSITISKISCKCPIMLIRLSWYTFLFNICSHSTTIFCKKLLFINTSMLNILFTCNKMFYISFIAFMFSSSKTSIYTFISLSSCLFFYYFCSKNCSTSFQIKLIYKLSKLLMIKLLFSHYIFIFSINLLL